MASRVVLVAVRFLPWAGKLRILIRTPSVANRYFYRTGIAGGRRLNREVLGGDDEMGSEVAVL